MPIITTPGQQSTPVPKQDTAATLPSRLQSAFTPSPVRPIDPPKPIVTPTPVIEEEDDDINIDDDIDEVTGLGAPITQPSSTPVKPGTSLSRMSEEERRKCITSAFMLVLGKSPADRDYSYYRFSTLTEEGLTKSLLNLPEHKKLMEKAHEHVTLKQSVSSLDMQVKELTSSMDSMKQELITMQQLLIEKNRYIQQMRGIPEEQQQPLPVVQTMTSPMQTPPQPTTVTAAPTPTQLTVETRKLPGPFDELKNMFSGMFRRK